MPRKRFLLIRRSIGRCGAFAVVPLAVACAGTTRGAADADWVRARDVTATGAAAFSAACAECHGPRGGGLSSAPAILGGGALPEYPHDETFSQDPAHDDFQDMQIQQDTHRTRPAARDPLRSARDLHEYLVSHVIEKRAKPLKEDVYWALVTFILAAQGSAVPPGGVNGANAAEIPIARR